MTPVVLPVRNWPPRSYARSRDRTPPQPPPQLARLFTAVASRRRFSDGPPPTKHAHPIRQVEYPKRMCPAKSLVCIGFCRKYEAREATEESARPAAPPARVRRRE